MVKSRVYLINVQVMMKSGILLVYGGDMSLNGVINDVVRAFFTNFHVLCDVPFCMKKILLCLRATTIFGRYDESDRYGGEMRLNSKNFFWTHQVGLP